MGNKAKKVKKALKKRERKAEPGALRRWWDSLDDQRRRTFWLSMLATVVLMSLLIGSALGLRRLQTYVLSHPEYGKNRSQVQLADKPAWMPASLEQEIISELIEGEGDHPATFDPTVARTIAISAQQCPWVKSLHEVSVQRLASADSRYSKGVVLVRAEYRQPVALASCGDREEYIDDSGVVLPRSQVPTDRFYPHISGVVAAPPEPGRRWESPDLSAGLMMVSRLRREAYFNEITTIDVNNYDNRRNLSEPAIVLKAEANGSITDIRFGRLPIDDLAVGEPSTERKLGYLSSFYRKNGSLVGLRWLELRRDTLYVSEN